MNKQTNSGEEKNWVLACHLSAFAMFVFPLGNVLAPLIIWLIKKDEFPLLDDQGKEALNFQISVTLYLFVAGILTIIVIGIPLLIALGIFDIVMIIIAAIKVSEGEKYRYPLTIRFLK